MIIGYYVPVFIHTRLQARTHKSDITNVPRIPVVVAFSHEQGKVGLYMTGGAAASSTKKKKFYITKRCPDMIN